MTALRDAIEVSENYYGPNALMGTFFGSIDDARPIGLAGEASSAQAYERVGNAFAVLMTTRGAPSILYGDEIGLDGAKDPENRPMMAFDGLSAQQTSLRTLVENLGQIRRDHVALRKGQRQDIQVTDDLWYFEAFYGSDLVFVAINRADNDTTIDGLPASSRELLTATDLTGTSASIPARRARIFIPR
jgi:glycosidase